MTISSNDSTTEIVAGRFWLPEDPDHVVPGYFKLLPGGVLVELNGELTPSLREVNRTVGEDGSVVVASEFTDDGPRDSITVHGRLNNSPEEVTLLRCFTVYRKGNVFGHAADEQHLRAMYAVRGAHIGNVDERFSAFRLRLQHLDEWAFLTGFEQRRQDDEQQLIYRYLPAPAVGLANGGQITLKQDMAASHPTARGGYIRRTIWFSLSEIAMNWEELGRLITTPLVSLLMLCTGHECLPLEYEAQTQAGEWVQVFAHLTPPEADELKPHEMMVMLADVTLDGVGSWLDKVETLGPLPPVVANAASATNLRIETSLLELTTVAEGLHSRLFPDDRRMDTATAERIKGKVIAALQEEESPNRQAVSGMLRFLEDPSYPKRLRRLAQEVATAVPGITGNTKKWVEQVNDCRNEFAHRRAGFISNDALDKYYGVIVSLRWVLAGMLLLQTGIDPNVLAARVSDDQSFSYFLRQAADYLPDVYRACG